MAGAMDAHRPLFNCDVSIRQTLPGRICDKNRNMPWLPLYIDETDASHLLAVLNSDPEVAFIVSTSPGKWTAQKGIASITDSRYCLWHSPSGSLPLVGIGPRVADGVISDPWAGWTEQRAGADTRVPFFGAGAPGVIWWNVQTRSRSVSGIGLSSFEWIGNRYRILGYPAHPATEAWWKKLKKLMKDQKAIRIPRSGPLDGPKPEIWCFPSALKKVREGMPRDVNPF